MSESFDEHTERLSDVDGYTIVERSDHSPRIHLLRPWNECNTEKTKSGRDTVRVSGSREKVLAELGRLGHRSAVSCKRCFPYDPDLDSEDDSGEPQFDIPPE